VSRRLREQVAALLAAPLAPPALTAELVAADLDHHVEALQGWLARAADLSPDFRYARSKEQPAGGFRIETRTAPRGSVCFRLAGGPELERGSERLVKDTLSEHDDDLIVLVLCSNSELPETQRYVTACLQIARTVGRDRLIVVEPDWAAALLVERAKPLVPGDLDRASRLAPTPYFDAGDARGSNGVRIRRTEPSPVVSALTDKGLARDRLQRTQAVETPSGPIYLCTTFLPPITHSQRAVKRFYRHQGGTKTTLEHLTARHHVERDTWLRHIADYRRVDVIDRAQLEEYLSAPEYYRMPLTPRELREQIKNLEELLAHDNYVLCLTPEAIDIPFEIRGDEVRIRTDRRNKGQPRQGRIANIVLRDPSIRDAFEREFWSAFSQTEYEFIDHASILKWLRERATRYSRAEGGRRAATEDFDVFLCHNSEDKPKIERLARRLERLGIRPWFDKWHAPPGTDWFWEINRQMSNVRCAAVFIGRDGLGPWQREEIGGLLVEFVRRKSPVIPVVLRDADDPLQIPAFLQTKTWVDLRKRNQFQLLADAVLSSRVRNTRGHH
jgi:nucleotide-binding universal stress UspA family protein